MCRWCWCWGSSCVCGLRVWWCASSSRSFRIRSRSGCSAITSTWHVRCSSINSRRNLSRSSSSSSDRLSFYSESPAPNSSSRNKSDLTDRQSDQLVTGWPTDQLTGWLILSSKPVLAIMGPRFSYRTHKGVQGSSGIHGREGLIYGAPSDIKIGTTADHWTWLKSSGLTGSTTRALTWRIPPCGTTLSPEIINAILHSFRTIMQHPSAITTRSGIGLR